MTITFTATSKRNLKSEEPEDVPITSLEDTIKESLVYDRAYQPARGDDESDCDSIGDDTSRIIQCSTGPAGAAYENQFGLLSAVLEAYNQHYDLILDPNDVWATILAQFSAYINGENRAELLRDKIVNFQGKKKLVVRMGGSLLSADFGTAAISMVDEIASNIKDSSLREWFMPQFSTTTTTDKVCCAASCMSAMQAYFKYEVCLMCGIPNVTLTGTVEDWILLRKKIDRLAEFDLSDKLMSSWLVFLRPVCDNLVASAQGKRSLEFWDTICSQQGGGSGPRYLSGWITSFSVFSDEGKWQGEVKKGAKWPRIDTQDLNHNITTTPVSINDNGTNYQAMLFSGQFIHELDETKKVPVVRPRNDWCISIKE